MGLPAEFGKHLDGFLCFWVGTVVFAKLLLLPRVCSWWVSLVVECRAQQQDTTVCQHVGLEMPGKTKKVLLKENVCRPLLLPYLIRQIGQVQKLGDNLKVDEFLRLSRLLLSLLRLLG